MTQAALFLAENCFGFFTLLFLLRFYMQLFRVSFFGPLVHFVVALTHWAVRPLRRIIPPWGNIDLASLLPAYLLQLGWTYLFHLFFRRLVLLDNQAMALFYAWSALLGLLRHSLYLLIGALILQAVLSWVNPRSPLASPVDQFTRPILNPIRRFLPPVSGFDLSPLVAVMLAQALLFLL